MVLSVYLLQRNYFSLNLSAFYFQVEKMSTYLTIVELINL